MQGPSKTRRKERNLIDLRIKRSLILTQKEKMKSMRWIMIILRLYRREILQEMSTDNLRSMRSKKITNDQEDSKRSFIVRNK